MPLNPSDLFPVLSPDGFVLATLRTPLWSGFQQLMGRAINRVPIYLYRPSEMQSLVESWLKIVLLLEFESWKDARYLIGLARKESRFLDRKDKWISIVKP